MAHPRAYGGNGGGGREPPKMMLTLRKYVCVCAGECVLSEGVWEGGKLGNLITI